jgi:hypothetical protein
MREDMQAMRRSSSPVRRALGTLGARAMADPAGLMRRYGEARPKELGEGADRLPAIVAATAAASWGRSPRTSCWRCAASTSRASPRR